MDRLIPDEVVHEITTLTRAAFLLGEDGHVALGYEVLRTVLSEQQQQQHDAWTPQVVQHLHETLASYHAAFALYDLRS
jgi:hypothetical protein